MCIYITKIFVTVLFVKCILVCVKIFSLQILDYNSLIHDSCFSRSFSSKRTRKSSCWTIWPTQRRSMTPTTNKLKRLCRFLRWLEFSSPSRPETSASGQTENARTLTSPVCIYSIHFCDSFQFHFSFNIWFTSTKFMICICRGRIQAGGNGRCRWGWGGCLLRIPGWLRSWPQRGLRGGSDEERSCENRRQHRRWTFVARWPLWCRYPVQGTFLEYVFLFLLLKLSYMQWIQSFITCRYLNCHKFLSYIYPKLQLLNHFLHRCWRQNAKRAGNQRGQHPRL